MKWLTYHAVLLLVRLAVTLGACYLIEQVVRAEGYRVEFSTLVLAAACIIITVRFWAPGHEDKDR